MVWRVGDQVPYVIAAENAVAISLPRRVKCGRDGDHGAPASINKITGATQSRKAQCCSPPAVGSGRDLEVDAIILRCVEQLIENEAPRRPVKLCGDSCVCFDPYLAEPADAARRRRERRLIQRFNWKTRGKLLVSSL